MCLNISGVIITMCGISFYYGVNPKPYSLFINSRRGSDSSKVINLSDMKIWMAFHRLAINGIGSDGDQPMLKHGCYLICNGEIYNHKQLEEENGFEMMSRSDCEVILDLHRKYYDPSDPSSVGKYIPMLTGVFSFVVVDTLHNSIIVSRDRFGVRPLYEAIVMDDENPVIVKSIILSSLQKGVSTKYSSIVRQFQPGSYYCIQDDYLFSGIWYSLDDTLMSKTITDNSYDNYKEIIRNALITSVRRRLMSERPIGCLLSGGVDSSLITSLVVREYVNNGGKASDIHTFSIGMTGSPDVKFADKVAKHLGTTHHYWEYTEAEFLRAIPDVVQAIETYDITTIRASVGNWLIGKNIREHTDIRVVFNGDGADEVCGGYAYLHNAPTPLEFDNECRRLVKNIHYYDVLRSDRSIADNDLEPRTPFLDHDFVETYMSVPVDIRWTKPMSKTFLRDAFSGMDLLPEEVLWRPKEAFSDGVSSSMKRTWGDVIKEYASSWNPPQVYSFMASQMPENLREIATSENVWYSTLFMRYFGKSYQVIPGYWMPKWTDVKDPSARSLNCYEISNTRDEQ